ncbi:MAG: nucleoside deaminase [bacterium]
MELSITINLPEWLAQTAAQQAETIFACAEDKMRLAIALARRNVQEKTGGPFGAAIFDERSNRLVSLAVNAVVSENLSVAHAETLATILAQRKLGTYDLAQNPETRYALYSSGQPCIMCFGVTWWSGITKLVCAARSEDIEEIVGFKEGPLPEAWVSQLQNRRGLPAIEVVQDLLREEVCEVLRLYAASGQPVYNAGKKRR